MIKPLALLSWFTCDSYVLWSVESETLPTLTMYKCRELLQLIRDLRVSVYLVSLSSAKK